MDNRVEQEYWMAVSTNIAYTNIGRTGKKPSVGAVIVKNGVMLSSGITSPSRQHAEQIAVSDALERGIDITGSTMFTTLEPCSHYGETPPCVRAIVAAKIQNVVIGVIDPDIRVSGSGIEYLQNNGVNVNVLNCESVRNLYKSYFIFQQQKRPYIVLKIAQSLDGKIAIGSGISKWITGEKARHYTNFLRSRFDGILIGMNTLRSDSPQLDCRIEGLTQFSPKKFVTSGKQYNDFISVEGEIKNIVSQIYECGIQHLLVEGGANLITQFIKDDLFDEIILIQAPMCIGNDGISSIKNLCLNMIPSHKMQIIEQICIEDNIINRLQNKKTVIANT